MIPCRLCGSTNYANSLGGPGICPSCDCGNPPNPNRAFAPSPFMPYRTASEEDIKLARLWMGNGQDLTAEERAEGEPGPPNPAAEALTHALMRAHEEAKVKEAEHAQAMTSKNLELTGLRELLSFTEDVRQAASREVSVLRQQLGDLQQADTSALRAHIQAFLDVMPRLGSSKLAHHALDHLLMVLATPHPGARLLMRLRQVAEIEKLLEQWREVALFRWPKCQCLARATKTCAKTGVYYCDAHAGSTDSVPHQDIAGADLIRAFEKRNGNP